MCACARVRERGGRRREREGGRETGIEGREERERKDERGSWMEGVG